MDSPLLRQFLGSLGRVQHHVYTAVVGLTAVEAGVAQKPADLDISWSAGDLVGSARESRRFLLRSTLVMLAEELNEYARRALRLHGKILPKERSARLDALGPVTPAYIGVAAKLTSHWRNRIIHRHSTTDLTAKDRQQLQAAAVSIREEFKNLDVGLLLEHFERNQPTLKDVTVLLAMSIRFVKNIDRSLPQAVNATTVKAWLEALDLLEQVQALEKQALNGGSRDPRSRARQFLRTSSSALAEPYYVHGTA